MTSDVLDRAKNAIGDLEYNAEYIWKLLEDLVSEIERLRAEIRGLVKSILSNDDKDKLIQVLETAYLDAKAARIYYEHVQDGRSWEDYPEEPCHMRPKKSYREEANERLEELWRTA